MFYALLIVAVIIAIYYWKKEGYSNDQLDWLAQKQQSIDRRVADKPLTKRDKIANALNEQRDHFEVAVDDKAQDYACDNQPRTSAPQGDDYNSFVIANAVDNSVVKNHARFVEENKNSAAVITGRTWSADAHDSYDPVQWIGIRGRPQRVAVDNPDQEPDIDISLFPEQQRLRW